jgi:hypothetical protein
MSEESRKAELRFDARYRRHPLEVKLRQLQSDRALFESRVIALSRQIRKIQYELTKLPPG